MDLSPHPPPAGIDGPVVDRYCDRLRLRAGSQACALDEASNPYRSRSAVSTQAYLSVVMLVLVALEHLAYYVQPNIGHQKLHRIHRAGCMADSTSLRRVG
eukprot:jgi/Ulvmu1/9648/UM054_0080.1